MFGFVIGTLYANALEWVLHRYVLHGIGKRRDSTWSFHFHEHHRAARRNWMSDPDYERRLWGWHAQGKEAFTLLALGVMHLPLWALSPGFVLGLGLSGWNYYRWHRRSHEDPDWARRHLSWHYDHHMGPDQDANWCVSWPWFDWLMGTRKPYAGTERERDARRRHAERAHRKAVATADHAASLCVTESPAA